MSDASVGVIKTDKSNNADPCRGGSGAKHRVIRPIARKGEEKPNRHNMGEEKPFARKGEENQIAIILAKKNHLPARADNRKPIVPIEGRITRPAA